MKYNICVPIPVKSLKISENAPIIKKVLYTNPNLIELRFDYINDVQNITKDFISSLLNRIQPKVPVISTFRDSSEGGHIKIDKNERFQILKVLIETKPKYLDIELNTEKDVLSEVIHLASQYKVKLIFSYHDFEKTPSYIEANNLIEKFLKKLNNEMLIDPKIVESGIYKLIFTAHSFEDNLLPLQLCKTKPYKKQRFISFCMGDLGLFSRITCIFSGSFLTYGYFEEKTALGQIHIKEIRRILKLMNFSV